jgi:transposase
VARAQDADELRCAQAILLPALTGATLQETAALLGVGRASVARLQARFRKRSVAVKVAPRNWGGRRRALLTWKEEEKFLAPWAEQAREGRMLVVSTLRAAFAQNVGRPSYIGCWSATADARSRRTPGTRPPIRRRRRTEKKLPQVLADLLDAKPVKPRRVRLMFQDEARFGRIVRIKRCWVPAPLRPVVDNG